MENEDGELLPGADGRYSMAELDQTEEDPEDPEDPLDLDDGDDGYEGDPWGYPEDLGHEESLYGDC